MKAGFHCETAIYVGRSVSAEAQLDLEPFLRCSSAWTAGEEAKKDTSENLCGRAASMLVGTSRSGGSDASGWVVGKPYVGITSRLLVIRPEPAGLPRPKAKRALVQRWLPTS